MLYRFKKFHFLASLVAVFGVFATMPFEASVPSLVGILALVIYVAVVSQPVQSFIVVYFHGKRGMSLFLISSLLVVFFVTALAGALLSVAVLTPLIWAGVLALVSLALFLLGSQAPEPTAGETTLATLSFETPVGLASSFGVVILLALLLDAVYLFVISRTGGHVTTPWQTIVPGFLPVAGGIIVILGLLIGSRIRASVLLFFLVLSSLVLHSYVPATHELLYGADGWRHIGFIQNVIQEKPMVQAVLNETPHLGSYLTSVTYGQFWSLFSLVNRTTGINLLMLMIWLGPVLVSVLLPFLMYALGSVLGLKVRGRLALAWLSLLPYALMSAGSFSLPVNLGLVFFIVSLILILERVRSPHKKQLLLLTAIGFASIFSYSLFAVLYWFTWFTAEAILASRRSSRFVERAVLIKVTVLGVILLPAIEIISRYSQFSSSINWLQQIQQLIGNFSAFYLASGPRPHDIATGNILFNQVPSYSFVPTLLTTWRWWLVAYAVVFFVAVIWGTVVSYRSKRPAHTVMAVLTTSLFGGYIISRYALVGEQIFTRRLDSLLALVSVVMVLLLARAFVSRYGAETPFVQRTLVGAVVLSSLAMIASYTLGPDTGTVSVDEFRAMKYVSNTLTAKPCVVAGTYPLLALEAVTGRAVIGGGFPVNQYFAQPVLEEVYTSLTALPTKEAWDKALSATGADQCFLVVPSSLSVGVGTLTQVLDTISIWRYTK
jgi:hypothetical protein